MAGAIRLRLCAVLPALALALAAVIPILACGGTALQEHIPLATLAPADAVFRVAILSSSGQMLEARAGRDGTLLWKQQLGPADHPALVYADGTLYRLSHAAPMVTAVRPSDGAVLWRLGSCSGYDDTLYVGADLLYVTCGSMEATSPASVPGDTVDALDPKTGRIVWSAVGAHARAVGAGLVVAQTPTGLAGMDAASGSVRWSHRVQFAAEARPTDIRVYFKMAVSVAGQAIYYSPDGALVEALRTSDGALVWHSALVDDPALPLQYHVWGDVIVAAVTPDVVVAKARYGVAALDRADGAIRWRYYSALEPEGMQAAVGDDGSVYALSWVHPKDTQLSLTAFASDNGAVRWQVPGPILRQAQLTPSGGTVLAEDGGVLLAYRVADGVRTWDDTALYSGPLAASAYVVCIQSLDSVYLLKTTDGTKVWKLSGYGQEAMSLVLMPG